MAIDFTLSPELEEIRMRVRSFVEEVIKPEEARIEGADSGTIEIEGVSALSGAQHRVIADRIEGAVEHTNDLGRLVGDGTLLRLVPEQGHGDPTAVGRVGRGVDLMQQRLAVD